VDVAINEVERLISQEKVEIVNGVYASAQAVPLAAKVEAQKKILWITTAIATAVFKDKNLQYVFRGQIHSDQYGQAFASFIADNAKAKLGAEPSNVKVAIIHEDGPYGVGVADASERFGKEKGLQIVMVEGYSATAPDLSSLVTKLKRAGADVVSQVGYNPDITLFLRQARESGLRFKMLVGNGAGYSQLDKLRATFGADIDNFCNIDPVPAQLLNPASLAPGMGDLIKIMIERYKAKTNANDVPPHCSMGFNQTWVLLNNVLPVAKEKYGGFDAEAVRQAALDVDIPPGATIQGYGVKFYRPGTQLAGQNERSTPVVMQNAGEHISVVWPNNIRTQEPVLPLPASSVYAMR
jgi:branched-chain amino acid transport system substrate-binding protein